MTFANAAPAAPAGYLDALDAAAPGDRWPLARGWCGSEPTAFFAELRARRPVLEAGDVLMVAKRADVIEILSLPTTFTVELYHEKMGDFMLARDETPTNYRDKAVMRAFLALDDLPRIRTLAGEVAAEALAAANGKIEVVTSLSRLTPLRVVQRYFGIEAPDADLLRWSFANQVDQFNNLPFDGRPDAAEVSAAADRARAEMRATFARLIPEKLARLKQDPPPDDVFSRVLKTAFPSAVGFGMDRVVINVGGLLIGAIETISEAIVNALDYLLADRDRLEAARAAAADPKTFDGHVWEALRFAPIVAFMFRRAATDHLLARGTPREVLIPAGTTVLPLSMSAMFDPDWVDDPEHFRPGRPWSAYLHFGWGHHECLGRHVGAEVIPEVVRQILLHGGQSAVGPVDYAGTPFPARYEIVLAGGPAPLAGVEQADAG